MAAKLVNDNMLELDARRCVSVTNKMTGNKFNRPDNPGDQGWYLLYENCKLNSSDWGFEFDAELASEVKGEYKYSEQELTTFSMPKLRKIGAELGATGEGKPDLIKAILKAQG